MSDKADTIITSDISDADSSSRADQSGLSSPELCLGSEQSDSEALIFSERSQIKLKDFKNEVRALMDVEQFAHEARIFMDMAFGSIVNIVNSMLVETLSLELPGALEGAQSALLVGNSVNFLSNTIQGATFSHVCSDEPDKKVSSLVTLDCSWLVASCHIAQLSRRHMVLARLLNGAKNWSRLRLIMLVMTPSQEKETKSNLETSRTFATLFCSSHFRRQLLEAKSEQQLKGLFVLKARELSGSSVFTNRHRYALDPVLLHTMDMIQQQINERNSIAHSGGKVNSFSMMNKMTLACNPDRELYENNNVDGDFRQRCFSSNSRANVVLSHIELTERCDSQLSTKELISLAKESQSQGQHEEQACCSFIWQQMEFGTGIWEDFSRRKSLYLSDFRDAFLGPPGTLRKTIATTWFLYFGILLPIIAFDSLNYTQTDGKMGGLNKSILGQGLGGLAFALLGGQPLVIIMTTAPLCLYTKVIYRMCLDYGFDFTAMYAAVGLWNGFFLLLYSLFGFSRLMKWCTRGTEEIFALFIVVAFITDAWKDTSKNFQKFYYSPACQSSLEAAANSTSTSLMETSTCRRDTSLLFLLLMLATVWLGYALFRMIKTPYFSTGTRTFLSDYALPIAVLVTTYLGSCIFDQVYVEEPPIMEQMNLTLAPLRRLPFSGVLLSLGLGFTLSLLFFMDQNISAAMVNAPQNRLKKGCAYHYDLLVVGVLNAFLTLYGFPMMHGVLPHSPLHVRSLADIEETQEDGHLSEKITNVRETRVTAVVSHLLIIASLLLIPKPIGYIPRAVLNGLFLYMALTSLDGLAMFDRILLLFTEQSKYPPSPYVRRCPQRVIHKFTGLQLIQLIVMCLFGFSPVNAIEMFFPVIIFLMIPFRHKIVTKLIDEKHLDTLDGMHHH